MNESLQPERWYQDADLHIDVRIRGQWESSVFLLDNKAETFNQQLRVFLLVSVSVRSEPGNSAWYILVLWASTVVQKWLKTHQWVNVALGDMLLHHHEHGHCSSFQIITYTAVLLQTLASVTNMYSSTAKNSPPQKSHFLLKLDKLLQRPAVLGNYWDFQKTH